MSAMPESLAPMGGQLSMNEAAPVQTQAAPAFYAPFAPEAQGFGVQRAQARRLRGLYRSRAASKLMNPRRPIYYWNQVAVDGGNLGGFGPGLRRLLAGFGYTGKGAKMSEHASF